MKVIAIANQKGGVGKSTLSDALASGLSRKGYRVLSVDMDAQANLTEAYKASTKGGSVLGLLTKEIADAATIIQHTERGDIIAGAPSLAGADGFITETGREYILREALSRIQTEYDYCIIDTPPALGILLVNALTCASEVIIPTTADYFSLKGLRRLSSYLEPIRKYFNAELKLSGILLTKYSGRSTLSKEIRDTLRQEAEAMGSKLFETTIREAVAVREAQTMGQSLYDYAPKQKVTADYEAFIKEYLGEDKG